MAGTRLTFSFVIISLFSCGPKKIDTNFVASETAKVGKTAPTSAATKSNEIPPITLIEPSGNRLTASSLQGNLVLIFFSADCDHCQREAIDIEKNLPGFKNYSLYFVSMNQFSQMEKFAATYKLAGKANVHFIQADGRTVFESMGSIQTPTICVYNKDKKLVKRFDGETKVDQILKVL